MNTPRLPVDPGGELKSRGSGGLVIDYDSDRDMSG